MEVLAVRRHNDSARRRASDDAAERWGIMGDTGIVRRVDDLGRIVIPMELRRTLDIKVKDPMSISVEGERVILEKYRDSCTLCGSRENLISVKDRPLCSACVEVIKKKH